MCNNEQVRKRERTAEAVENNKMHDITTISTTPTILSGRRSKAFDC